jgi:hypothetical protein
MMARGGTRERSAPRSFQPALATPHPLKPRARAARWQSPRPAPLLAGLLPSPLAILTEPDLEEHEAGRENDTKADQAEREYLAKRAAH